MKNKLQISIVKVSNLTHDEKQGMWNLFKRYYEDVNIENFLHDLMEKNDVLLIKDHEGVKGFTTLIVYEHYVGHNKARILFTGDTIKDEKYWGEKKSLVVFIKYAFMQWLKSPMTPFYWFLISKGYKTYLYLSRNFVDYWPRPDVQTPQHVMQRISALAIQRYGDNYDEATGLIKFKTPCGRLKQSVAAITNQDLEQKDIKFFLSKNPSFDLGYELCCLGKFNIFLWASMIVNVPLSIFRKKHKSRQFNQFVSANAEKSKSTAI